jgi:hypothetical protein
MVVALIALFVALGGPAEAKKRLMDGGLIRKGTVTGREIKNGSVAKADLTKAAVRALSATPASSVGSAQIIDGQVLAPDLGAGSVGPGQLAAGAVTASKLAADSVGGGSVANGSLQTTDIGSFAGRFRSTSTTSQARPVRRHAIRTRAAGRGASRWSAEHRRRRGCRSRRLGLAGQRPRHGQAGARQQDRDRGVPRRGAPVDPGPTIFRYVTFDAP